MNLSPTVAVKLSWFGTKNGEVRPLTSRACSHVSVVRVVYFGVEHFLWNIWVGYVMERNINDPVTTSLLSYSSWTDIRGELRFFSPRIAKISRIAMLRSIKRRGKRA